MKRTKKSVHSEPRFRVGDWVRWGVGPSKQVGIIFDIEGPPGLKGGPMYAIRTFPLWTPIIESGLSEQFLEPAEPPTALPEPHDKFPMEKASWRRLDD